MSQENLQNSRGTAWGLWREAAPQAGPAAHTTRLLDKKK